LIYIYKNNRNKHKAISDANIYVSLVVESLVPKIAEDGTIKLQIKPTHDVHDKASRDKAFVQDIIPLIKLRRKRKSTAMLTDEFLQECYHSLSSHHLSTGHAPSYSEFSTKAIQARVSASSLFVKNYMGNNEMSYREKKLLGSRHPLTSLLAIIRKQGMDLLLPSIVQDKVLVTVYVAINSESGPAHKVSSSLSIFTIITIITIIIRN